MELNKEILTEIKRRIKETEPDAQVFLYGSFARGDANEESDVDLLILVNKKTISFADKKKLTIPLFRLGYEKGHIISPFVETKDGWEKKYSYTPLYSNIRKEGLEI